ncbi:hypothetical protein ACFL1X_06850, partial [Candidatus Hydrogenedentota bacterium]
GDVIMASDLDNDGADELIIGAPQASLAGRPHVGITYVAYGGEALRDYLAIDLGDDAPEGVDIVKVYGPIDTMDQGYVAYAAGNITGPPSEERGSNLILASPISDNSVDREQVIRRIGVARARPCSGHGRRQ